MTKQRGDFDTHIGGIPCQIKITSYFRQRTLGQRADSDIDCYGYTDAEYTVLDREGYPALWLDRKIKDEDNERILSLIDNYKEHENDDY